MEGDTGSVVLILVGAEAVLTALAPQRAKPDLMFLEVRRAAKDILKLVG